MDRFVLTARLKPDGRRRALALLADRYDDACQAAGGVCLLKGRTGALTWNAGKGTLLLEPEVADGYRRSQRCGIFDHSCDVEHPFS
jgi:hypothetical protein